MIHDSVDSQSSSHFSLKGVYAASLTPWNTDLSCDVHAMAEHCKDLINRGCSGVVIFGTTGEGPSFSVGERKRVIKSLIESGIEPGRIIVGISCCAVPDVVELAQEALKQHCAAVLIVPPFFYKKVDEEGVAAFYREVVGRVGNPALRIILYHIPQLSGIHFTLNLIRMIDEEFPEQVIGIKESEGNLNLMREILSQFPKLNVYAGNELLLTEAVRLGASGGILGMANLFPETLLSLYEFGKDPAKADHNEQIKAIRNIMNHYSFIPALKSIMVKKHGAAWKLLLPPLVPLDSEKSRTLFSELSGYF